MRAMLMSYVLLIVALPALTLAQNAKVVDDARAGHTITVEFDALVSQTISRVGNPEAGLTGVDAIDALGLIVGVQRIEQLASGAHVVTFDGERITVEQALAIYRSSPLVKSAEAGAPNRQAAGIGVQPVHDPADIDAAITAHLGAEFFTIEDIAIAVVEPGKRIAADLVIAGRQQRLVMQPHSMRAGDMIVLEQLADGSLRYVEPPAPRTYRGSVDGEADSIVAASLNEDGSLSGVVRIGRDVWGVQPLREALGDASIPAARHVIYRQQDVVPPQGVCGVTDLPGAAEAHGGHDEGGIAGSSASGGVQVDIAFDADFEFYQLNGSNTASTLADIEMVMNAVESLYHLDLGIAFRITTTIVRTAEPDPYTSTNSSTLLNQVTSQWNNFHGAIVRDLTQLMTGKNVDGGTIGIAWQNVACSAPASAYSVVQSRYDLNLLNRLSLSAHELGHNFSASHCSGSDCGIMCPTIGQCNNNLTGWGALSTAEIVAKKNSAPCLSALSTLGACCVGSTCTQVSASECGTAGGIWSANTPCTTRTTYSATPNLAIPDGNGTGITHTITVNDSYLVSDLNLRVNIPHTWIGDLTVELQHNGGPFVMLINQMGVPQTQFGCDANNLNVLLDDEAAAGLIENVCSDQFPGATPGNAASSGPAFLPNAPLSAFNGQNAQGTWTLRVRDLATPDPGTLASWSLSIENAASGLCVPQGACCVGTTCTQTSQTACGTSGGTWTAGQACYQSLTFTTNPNAPIPDGNANGVSNTLNVGTAFPIHDLNLRLVLNHTWVGDLVVKLSHNGGPFVTVIDRPGVPASQFGCEGDNYNIVLDDEGVGGPIENLCGLPANPQSPPNYTPANPLSFFDGQNMAGTWTINIADFVTPDAGTLLSWSLTAEDNDTDFCAETDAIVDCITYTSPHPRILDVTIKVVDGSNAPLPGANVTIHLTGTNGVNIVASGTTGANGTVLFSRRFTAACYTTDVTSIVLPGYSFDGTEPVNGYQKNVDTAPDTDCRAASDLCGSG